MGNCLSRHRRNEDYQQSAPPSSVPVSVSTSQTHEDEGSTQSHTHQSKSTVPENKESLTILAYQDQLINAISTHTLSIAGVIREYGFISDENFGNVLCASSTQEKAIILVNAVKERIKTSPKRLPELIRVFLEQAPTKDMAEMLQSAYQVLTRDTALHLPSLHFQRDKAAVQLVSYKSQNVTQADSMRVSSTDSDIQPASDPSHQ